MWRPGHRANAAALVLQTCGLIGFSQTVPSLSALIKKAENLEAHSNVRGSTTEIRGLHRVTRHPGLWSLGLLGAGTALSTPFAPEIVFFAMPCVFAFIGGAHQDYRHRRGWGGLLTPEVDAQTSNVPFVALMQGRQSWDQTWSELKQDNAAAAAVLALLLAALRLRRR